MTYALSHKSDPRFVRNWESNNPTSPVPCSFVKIWLSSWLGYEWKSAMAVTTPRNPSCEVHFPWKNIRNQGAVGRITCKFTFTSERKTRITWENTRKVNPSNAAGFLRNAFLWKKIRNVGAVDRRRVCLRKHKESGRVSVTHVLVEKRYGVRERLVTLNARPIFPKKTQGIWRVGTTRIFLVKHTESAGVGHAWHIKLQSKWSPVES